MTRTLHDASDIEALIDLYVSEHEVFWHEADRPNGAEAVRPAWRCSSLGYCMRRQILERAGTPPTNEPDEMARRRFQAGDDMHWFLRKRLSRMGLLLGEEIAMSDPDLNLTGHIDAIYGGEPQEIPERWRLYRKPDWIFFLEHLRETVKARYGALPIREIEIKSMNSWAMSQVDQHGRFDHMMQLGGYYLLSTRHPDTLPAVPDEYEVVLIGRDSVAIRRIALRKTDVEQCLERITLLNEAWETGKWSPCTCGQTDGLTWEQKYCWFVDREDPSTCCGQTLLDKLEASLA